MIPAPSVPEGRRPVLLDLFSGAGGAAMGYYRAGFDVVGVDINPQPNYPFLPFVLLDALVYLACYPDEIRRRYAAIHASPPCQAYCAPSQYNGNRETYPDLVVPVRAALQAIGLPYIIENTPGAPLINPAMLCGTMFDLPVYRHRLFETNMSLSAPAHLRHSCLCARNGVLPSDARPFMTITGGKHSKTWTRAAARAMGVEWMQSTREVCEAIPPAYTEHLGKQLLAHVQRREAA